MADGGNPIFSPPRSTASFGVSGLLAENCRVFYDSIFTTRHLGRVADLLSARLQKAGPDELRLRALLLFLAYEGFRAQFPVEIEQASEDEDPTLALKAPLTIECGIDDEKIAVGVSFEPHGTQQLDISGLEERVRSGTPANRIERALCELLAHSGSVFLRQQPATGRVELAAWIGIRDKTVISESRGTLELHEIPADPEAAPRAQQYAELGDEDYETLLKDEAKGRGDSDDDSDSEKKFGADDEDEDDETKLGGKDANEKERKRRLGGNKRKVDGSRTVSGSEDDEADADGSGEGETGDSEAEDAQRLGGRDPKRKGRMKASGEAEDQEDDENEDDLKLGGGERSRKGGRKLGVKSDEEEEADSDQDEEQVRLGSSGKGKSARKIGVKSSESGGREGSSDDGDDDMRLGSGDGSRGTKRSREEREEDERAIQDFDDSKVDPSNVSADQVQRYKDQIQRMSRKISDLEEDRAKWMRMVKSEAASGKSPVGAGAGDDSDTASDSDADDGLKLKRLKSTDSPATAESDAEGGDEESSNDGRDEMRIKKLKSSKDKGAEQDSSEEEAAEQEKEKAKKKKPGGFLSRLFGGGKKDDSEKTEADEEREGSGSSKGRGKSSGKDSDEDEQAEKPKKKKGFFGLGGDESDEDESKGAEKEQAKEKRKNSSEADSSEKEEDKSVQGDDPGEKAESLANDIEAGTFHKKMEKAKEELDEIRNRMKDERVKAWADGMMAEIMKEKARLGEMAKSLNQAFRAKEAEFNRKTQFLKQEVLNREEQIRKGQLAVGRVREQLAIANSGSERLKIQMSNLEQQESAARQKLQASERLTQVAKEDATALQRQVENLKAQALQSGSQGKKLELAQKELMSAKALVEKANKAADDMKKQNLALTEKLNVATQATSGAGGTEDLKRKLEAAGRVAAVHKKEAETFKGKLETTMKEEARLRAEVTKLQAEMKRMKALAGMQAAPGAAPSGAPAGASKKPGTPGGKAA